LLRRTAKTSRDSGLSTSRRFRQTRTPAIVHLVAKKIRGNCPTEAVTPGPHEHFPAKWNPVCRKKMLYFNKMRVF
jgi:hypothetical protein